MSGICFTDEQLELIDSCSQWFLSEKSYRVDKPYYSYSGAAGTGKTTVMNAIIDKLGLSPGEYVTSAYTGKAVTNLLKNGLPATTIHGLIYNVYTKPEKYVDEDGTPRVRYKLMVTLKEQLDPRLKLIIIDEATMVNDIMRDQLLSFGIPIIFVGDMNQLAPIFGISSVMLYPDFVLHQIMRQREGDPIVQIAHMILDDIPLHVYDYGTSRIIASIPMENNLLTDYDQILCAKNATRETVNQHIRNEVLCRSSLDPHFGDKVICRQNNWTIQRDGIFLTNGLVGDLLDVDRSTVGRGYYNVTFQPNFMSVPFEDIHMDAKFIRADYKERSGYGMTHHEKFEYGWAITVHVSQGSQFDRVLFFDDKFHDAESTKRLRYTAITRASQSIDVVLREDMRNYYINKWCR